MEGITFITLAALLALAIVFVKMAVVIIPQSETRIIERLGKYYATLKPGVNHHPIHRPRQGSCNPATWSLFLFERDRLA